MNAVPKPKLCRAKGCRSTFMPRNSFDQACSIRCAMKIARETPPATLERRARAAARAEKREARQRIKSLNKVCSEVQADVNLYVRVRDFGKGCISCPTGTVEDAGHFFPIGSKFRCSAFRFNTLCIHGQCRQCNGYAGGGNLHGYIAGIVARYGQAYLDAMYEEKRKAEHGELQPLTKDAAWQIGADHRRMARELGRKSNAAACA